MCHKYIDINFTGCIVMIKIKDFVNGSYNLQKKTSNVLVELYNYIECQKM